ncbi:Scr1 family TA system antitoxin-like transcriptional regulator [Kitasatospora sp. NPDC006697]|uniref:helix-turn-helix domain-containing protein n=1 Tax=Kitasatospora sp. NPDC006697 TaxID=3364020 RepID=UPI003698DBCA
MVNKKSVDPSLSPRHSFAVQLRRFREAANLTQAQLAKLMNYSASLISNIEHAKKNATLEFATLADKVLNAHGALVMIWWHQFNSALIEGFPEFVAKEAVAKLIRVFEIDLIPGLLQTEEYARALQSGNIRRGEATPEQAEERVTMVLTRQRLLTGERPPLIHAVIDEAALRRPIGGPAAMARQLRHLETLAQLPNIIIQVAPIALGADRPFIHPAILLTLPDRTTVAYTETEQRGYLEADQEAVESLSSKYDRLQVEALSRTASLAAIRKLREEFESYAE